MEQYLVPMGAATGAIQTNANHENVQVTFF